MRHVQARAILLATLVFVPATAGAEELRVHVAGGAAHAVAGSQQREFGAGGGGSATVELPVARSVGLQAGAGAIALSKGAPPSDEGLAAASTGTAMFGTVGVRMRPLAASFVAGPWIDLNGGVARTGDATRPAATASAGWAFRIAPDARWDAGPFIGYTHVLQPDGALRSDDARIAMVGIAVSLGAREAPRPSPAPSYEPVPVRAQPEPLAAADADGMPAIENGCPEGLQLAASGGCEAGEMILLVDRIHLDEIVQFEFGSARVRSRSWALLRKLAGFINRHPEILFVDVEGHSDAVGTVEFNQWLSRERALSIRSWLLKFGADADRIRVLARGQSQMRVDTTKAEELNRRVEFYVKRQTAQSASTSARPATKGAP